MDGCCYGAWFARQDEAETDCSDFHIKDKGAARRRVTHLPGEARHCMSQPGAISTVLKYVNDSFGHKHIVYL